MMYIIFALALTIALEGWVYNFLKPWNLKLFLVTMVMNSILNVAMNLVLTNLINPANYYYFLALFEIVTIVIETAILFLIFKEKLLKTFLFSLGANIFSLSFGLFINQFITSEKGAIIGSLICVIVAGILFGINLFIAGRFYNVNNSKNRKDDQGDKDSKVNNNDFK